jgi:hypothetical protein
VVVVVEEDGSMPWSHSLVCLWGLVSSNPSLRTHPQNPKQRQRNGGRQRRQLDRRAAVVGLHAPSPRLRPPPPLARHRAGALWG